MIENRSVAESISKLMIELSKELNESIRFVQSECSEEEFKTYRKAAAVDFT